MSVFLQNHPGERAIRPRPAAGNGRQGTIAYAVILLVAVPVAIIITVTRRLAAIGRIETLTMYTVSGAVVLLCAALLIGIMRKLLYKNRAEQKKYYRLAGGLSWLPAEKRESLQLEAHYGYHTGSWTETLEYWPSEVRLPSGVRFTTFIPTTKEDRLAGTDQAWAVLSEKSYSERIEALFEGLHSKRFAADMQLMAVPDRDALVARQAELTQLPGSYVLGCGAAQGSRPAALVWAFDLQRVVELSRSSFMAGIIPEQKAWEHILKASAYVHALFANADDFFNNYRLGHAYWCNDFRQTNETAQMHKAYNKDCDWPIKNVPWTIKEAGILPEVICNGCRDYVAEERRKRNTGPIGFRTGNNDTEPGL
ncbi:DUF1266 domain-containing protein [Taibaiella koreensis]|uniref:DUF1266 domain-containing protein n=1 Tax=Taibaiella koreensis TaxID=1268548 RepID=UPI000E5A05E0|nr:DUF1266 domain-containing protein [Taibaiella koreensis]